MNKRILTVIGIAIVLILSSILIVNISLSQTEEYLNDQVVEGIRYKEAKIIYENEETTYKVKVSSESEKEISYIEIIFKDEAGNEIENLIGYIGNKIDEEEREIVTTVDKEIKGIKSIEYKVVK